MPSADRRANPNRRATRARERGEGWASAATGAPCSALSICAANAARLLCAIASRDSFTPRLFSMRVARVRASSEWPPASKTLSPSCTSALPNSLGRSQAASAQPARASRMPRRLPQFRATRVARVRPRQTGGLELAVRQQRQRRETREMLGQPVGRQTPRQMRAQLGCRRRRLRAAPPGHKALVVIAALHGDDSGNDLRVRAQRGLDLAELNAIAAQFDLMVATPQAQQLARGQAQASRCGCGCGCGCGCASTACRPVLATGRPIGQRST